MTRRRPGGALLAASILALLVGCSSGSGTSPSHAEATADRIVYRVDDYSSAPTRVTTQVLELSAPYTARLVTRDGPPPGGASLGGSAWDGRRTYLIDPAGVVRAVQDVVPGFAGPDAHLDVALPVAQRLGLVVSGGARRTIAGTACATWRSREPLDSAAFAPPTHSDHTVTCVDAHGRVLSERWTLHGRLVRVRTAVEIGPAPSLSAARLFGRQTPQPAPTDASGLAVKPEPVGKLTAALGIGVPTPPAGFTLDRSMALIDVERSTGNPQVLDEGAAFSYLDGRHLIALVVKHGLQRRMTAADDGVDVQLGSEGVGRLLPVLSGLRVQFMSPRGLLVTVTGDVPETDLLTWVRNLPVR